MSGVSRLTIEARQKVKALVEREARKFGSRMAGYHAVSQMIGKSPEWVRAFACDYPNAKCDMTIMNINEAYRRAGHADGAS